MSNHSLLMPRQELLEPSRLLYVTCMLNTDSISIKLEDRGKIAQVTIKKKPYYEKLEGQVKKRRCIC